MKQSILLCSAIALLLLGAYALADTPDWIQSEERLVGENSTLYEDTLNRPAKTIWNTFLVEHDSSGFHNYSALATALIPYKSAWGFVESGDYDGHSHTLASLGAASAADVSALETSMSSVQSDVGSLSTSMSSVQGDVSSLSTSMSSVQGDVSSLESLFSVEHNADGTHDFSVPDPSEYALSGSGSGSLASASFSPTGLFTSGPFSIWGIVTFERLGVAESLLSSTSTEYSETIVNCYKDASNHLAAALGANLYTSLLVVSDLNRPTEIGCTFTGSQVFFWLDGQTDSAQAASGAFPSVNLMEQIAIGNALQGDVLSVSVSGAAIRSASGWFTPYREGLSQCPGCAMQYDMDEQSGSTLTDRAGSHDLTVSGSWQEYAAGY